METCSNCHNAAEMCNCLDKPGEPPERFSPAACSPEDFPGLREEVVVLEAMHAQYLALTKLGWQDATYCPKDRSKFLAITAGSTGVFPCYYEGEWPKGSWWIMDGGDLWPARPILWKPIPADAPVMSSGSAVPDSEFTNPDDR